MIIIHMSEEVAACAELSAAIKKLHYKDLPITGQRLNTTCLMPYRLNSTELNQVKTNPQREESTRWPR